MELFNIICGVCSILSLALAIISIFMVSSLNIRINNKGNNMSQGQAGTIKGKNVIQNFYNIQNPEIFTEYVKKMNEYQKGLSSIEPNDGETLTFTVENDQGETVKCEVLFTFESDETKKNYIVYTDNTEDKDGNTKVYASIYNPDLDETKLLPIETEKEWNVIETILDTLQESDDIDNTHKLIEEIDKKLKRMK